MDEIALRPWRQRAEGPAGREHELIPIALGIDAGGIEANNGRAVDPVAEAPAVASDDVDQVAGDNVFQKAEMRITVRRIDRNTALARVGRELNMAWTERQRLTAASGKRNGGCMEPLHLDPRHRPPAAGRHRLLRPNHASDYETAE